MVSLIGGPGQVQKAKLLISGGGGGAGFVPLEPGALNPLERPFAPATRSFLYPPEVDSVHFSLHVNGFSFWHEGPGAAVGGTRCLLVRVRLSTGA